MSPANRAKTARNTRYILKGGGNVPKLFGKNRFMWGINTLWLARAFKPCGGYSLQMPSVHFRESVFENRK